jgi:acetylornithine deacetylase/succinyl-diaminopimelate desuccinylase-like protein
MNAMQALDEFVASRRDKTLEELSMLTAQPSISAQGVGMAECAEMVMGMLEQRGFETEYLPTEGFPVIYAEREGRSEKTLLFYNHYDVQPPEPIELWDSPPFEPAIRDGKMFGRGVSDDKGHLLTRLAAIDAFLEVQDELPCRVKFVIEGEEEIGSVNLARVVEQNKHKLAAEGCVWEFGELTLEGVPIQYAGMRGICYVEITIETASRDSHSGVSGSIFPNAAWRLIWALSTLKDGDERIRIPGFYDSVQPPSELDMELLARLPEVSEEYKNTYGIQGFIKGLEGGVELRREQLMTPTCTICGLTSGYQGAGSKTVLPAVASAKVDFRLVPDQHPQVVLKQLRAHLDAEGFEDAKIKFLGGEPPGRTDLEDPFLEMVVQSAEEVYGAPMIIVPMAGGSGPNHAFIHHLDVPVATAGMGYPETRAHAPNENIRLDYFEDSIRHTLRIMAQFSE